MGIAEIAHHVSGHFDVDQYNFLSFFVICIAVNLFFFIVGLIIKKDAVTDLAYALTFTICALYGLIRGDNYSTRQIIVTVFILLWAVRLALYLVVRVIKNGGIDHRFDDVRSSILKWGAFWFFQAVTVFIVMFPAAIIYSCNGDFCETSSYIYSDSLGYTLFILGLIIETVADAQKFRYRSNPENDKHWCDVGIWSWSRHPNYFGEMLVWWGIFSICAGNFTENWMYFSIVSPLFIMLILTCASGIPPLEKSSMKRFGDNPEYLKYLTRTSILVPLPPFLTGAVPGVFKVYLCCDAPWMWKDSTQSKVPTRSKNARDGETERLTMKK